MRSLSTKMCLQSAAKEQSMDHMQTVHRKQCGWETSNQVYKEYRFGSPVTGHESRVTGALRDPLRGRRDSVMDGEVDDETASRQPHPPGSGLDSDRG